MAVSEERRRRRWSATEKAQIAAESLAPGAVVAEVARRHGLSAQHLNGWRRQAREGRLPVEPTQEASFVPVKIAREKRSAKHLDVQAPVMEIDAGAIHVRVHEGATAELVETMLRALRAPT
jgi:transposase